jgi:hypothetical protein
MLAIRRTHTETTIMQTRATVPVLIAATLLAAGCEGGEVPAQEAAVEPVPAQALAPAAESPAAAPAPLAASPGVLASQETNWPGIVAEVTEFRRRGNTLTARVRLSNQGSEDPQPNFYYNEAYLMDAAAGKKYEVLRDENGNYIAALSSGESGRWRTRMQPGASQTIWMKFPAPPPEVRAVTLQMGGIPPFEDLPIQDS